MTFPDLRLDVVGSTGWVDVSCPSCGEHILKTIIPIKAPVAADGEKPHDEFNGFWGRCSGCNAGYAVEVVKQEPEAGSWPVRFSVNPEAQ